MIALCDGLPLVKFDEGQFVAFERKWLILALLQAARKAGYNQWWLAEDVTESIATYFRFRYNENVVSLPRLSQVVRAVLQGIGYDDVSRYFKPAPPLSKISLLEIALAAGAGYELAFFNQLRRTLKSLLTTKTECVEMVDLERCVKHLRSKKIWSRDCKTLRTEIVAFAREQINLNHNGLEITLSCS